MFNVYGTCKVVNLKQVSPKLITGTVYTTKKVGDDKYQSTFLNAKFVGDACVKVFTLDIKNKDKFKIEKAILENKEYTNKNNELVKTLELVVFDINAIEENTNEKGNFDR